LEKTGLACFIQSTALSGEQLGTLLEDTYHLSYEAVTPSGVLMMLNPGLEDEALLALKKALNQIDQETTSWPQHKMAPVTFTLPTMAMTCREAFFAKGQSCGPQGSVGRVSRQVVAKCPPGIPVLMPGEMIEPHHLPLLPDPVMVVQDI
jgi:hypothetical protein